MKQYFYIWYTVYVNGLYCGYGRYPTAYSHKSSAVRRAKLMWSKAWTDPMTGDVIHREWMVSQGFPYEMPTTDNIIQKVTYMYYH